jgi:hypothetical protein
MNDSRNSLILKVGKSEASKKATKFGFKIATFWRKKQLKPKTHLPSSFKREIEIIGKCRCMQFLKLQHQYSRSNKGKVKTFKRTHKYMKREGGERERDLLRNEIKVMKKEGEGERLTQK